MPKDGDSGPGELSGDRLHTDCSDELFLWVLSSDMESTNRKSWGIELTAVIGQLSYQTGEC